MWKRLVARQVRARFLAVEQHDAAQLLHRVAEDVHHAFAGDHALGGERHDRVAFGQWLSRLARLCPTMSFELQHVLVSGPPWHVRVAAHWTARVQPAAGPAYDNAGVHLLRIRQGRLVELLAFEDSQVVAQACERMAALGVDEAGAPPITS